MSFYCSNFVFLFVILNLNYCVITQKHLAKLIIQYLFFKHKSCIEPTMCSKLLNTDVSEKRFCVFNYYFKHAVWSSTNTAPFGYWILLICYFCIIKSCDWCIRDGMTNWLDSFMKSSVPKYVLWDPLSFKSSHDDLAQTNARSSPRRDSPYISYRDHLTHIIWKVDSNPLCWTDDPSLMQDVCVSAKSMHGLFNLLWSTRTHW